MIALLCVVAAGCARTAGEVRPAPDFELRILGLVIENRTAAWLSAVQVLVPATGEFVSCGNIAPGADCSNQFPARSYRGNAVRVTWSQSGQIWSTGDVRLEPAESLVQAGEAVMRVVVSGPGSAGVELLETSP